MAITIDEKPTSRSATEGVDNSASATLEYIVRGTDDDSAVHALVQATIPAFYRGLATSPMRSATGTSRPSTA